MTFADDLPERIDVEFERVMQVAFASTKEGRSAMNSFARAWLGSCSPRRILVHS
jgi:hypothetical protein